MIEPFPDLLFLVSVCYVLLKYNDIFQSRSPTFVGRTLGSLGYRTHLLIGILGFELNDSNSIVTNF